MANLLITGGAGFIGSNFIHYYISKHPKDSVFNLDALTYAGNLHNLDDIKENPNYYFIKGNILNYDLVFHLIKEYQIDYIINFAAESHVDRSIKDPTIFIKTNVEGTQNLLEVAKNTKIKKFLQISTDEVYGSFGQTGYFTEDMPLKPNSPYSASKAATDLIVRSYFETYGLNINITRCSNNFGPHQFPEKLIPLMITHALQGEKLPIYGNGKNIRDWIYVIDHCRAIDIVLHKGHSGEIYNIGSHHERTNNQIVHYIAKYLNVPEGQIKYVTDRLEDDQRYAIDSSKIENQLNWKPIYEFKDSLNQTIEWYKDNFR